MALITYSPFEMQVDRLFNEAFRSLTSERAGWTPRCDVWEDANGFYVEAAVPGLDPKGIDIVVEDHVLTIKGERKEEVPSGSRTVLVQETGWGAFARSFSIPSDVDDSKATASYRNGVLRLEFPKSEEAKPRRIMIESK